MSPRELNDLIVYQKSMKIGEEIWTIVEGWNFFQKDTIGKQWVKSTDSIAANIAEGYGRYYYKENRLFCYYSRGSLQESRSWLTKAYNRKLISQEQFLHLKKELDFLSYSLNRYIQSIGK